MKDEVNIFEFTEAFPNETVCIAYLEQSKWANGKVISPFSGGEAYRISSRPGVYKCKETRQNFTVRQGTIFEESRLPLKKWFFAIFLLNSLKKGISSIQLAKYLGVTQRTAWSMLQRIRFGVEHEAFKRPLSGTIEVDETYSGGKNSGGKRGRGSENKTPVVGLAECGGDLHCESVLNFKTRTVGPIVREHVKIGSTLNTHEFNIYPPIAEQGYKHEVVNHGQKEYVRGIVHTNTDEGFWSHLKCGIKAIYIQISPKHLNKYCKEYQFRYNHRRINDFERFETWFNRCLSGRLTYQTLIA